MASPRSPRGARLSRPEPNLSTPRGVARSAPRVVTAGLFCASRPGNYSLLSLWATGGGGEYIVVNRPNCCAAPRLAAQQCTGEGGEGAGIGGRKSCYGPSAPTAPLLRCWLRAQLKLQRWRRRHLCRLSSSLFIRAPPPTPANRANPLPAEHSQYRGLVGGHLSLSDPMSGHPPATATSN